MISDKILQTRLLLFLLILSLSHLPLFAQKLTVESMQLLSNDVTAMTNQRQDLNGEYAGIVKVQLAVDGAKFEGNVIEQTKHETGEYWVWLAKDTKRMKIYAPGYLPLELNFYKSYGIKIEPKRTYQLVVASSSVVAPQSDNKGFLAFEVEPKNATLSIDGSKVGLLDGQYSNLVKQGSYEYEVTADGYESQSGRVQVTDQTQPVVVRLQSLMSTLLVSCATAGAEIYLDGQLRGKAPQTLTLLKGSHQVEARLEGYRSFREDISVSEKESRRLDIPSLTLLTGSLRVNYMPLGSDVYVDSKKLGVTPSTFREVAVGNRKVEVRKDGYTTAQVNAMVKENETADLSGNLTVASTPTQNNSVTQSGYETFSESYSSSDGIELFMVKGLSFVVSFRMVRVEGGTFTMGATSEQGSDAFDDEKPAHQVTLSSFWIGQCEVTQELWEAVMRDNPFGVNGKGLPMVDVSWNDCQNFIKKLNQLTGKQFRLPTEAEWEYVARGGSKCIGYKYSGGNDLGAVSWYDKNSGDKRHEVGKKQPNELGLYDMSGNVLEWCSDRYGKYGNSSQTNPTGPSFGSYHIIRGGSWDDDAGRCRVSIRYYYSPNYHSSRIGLRLAM